MRTELDVARTALEHGHVKRALRIAWSVAIASSTRDDRADLEQVIDLAETIRDRSEGHDREEAAALLSYCTYARDNHEPRRLFGLPFGYERRAVCPECRSRVNRDARFCSSCGARLSSGS